MLRSNIQKRIDMDLLNRSVPGIFIYAVMLPGIFWAFNFYTLYPELCLPYIVAMLIVSIARIFHKLATDYLYKKSPRLWIVSFSFLTLMHAGILGSIFAMALYDPRFESISHLMMLSMAAIASSALMAQTSRVKLALVSMTVLLLPSAIVCIFSVDNRPFVIMILLYYTYQTALVIRINKEYIRGLVNEEKLKTQQKKLKSTNQIDPLTGIYNRGYFNTIYAGKWGDAIRHKIEQSVLLIDIDYFKLVNDRHGHLVGDECLKHIARTLKGLFKRKVDLIARFGGEEFICLLSNTSIFKAMDLAEQAREKINSESFFYNNKKFNITVSVGVASSIPQEGFNPDALIDNADKALYKAKRQGRNCVCCYE